MENWVNREILIIGMTYPSYSRKYTETACTGGFFTDTYEMIRLFPNPDRYLEEPLHAWQFIRADVQKDQSDPRPESFRIRYQSIEVGEKLSRHSERREWINRTPHLFDSIETLREQQKERKTSLGIVLAREVVDFEIESRGSDEQSDWLEKEREVLAQDNMFEKVKPLDFIPAKFLVKWLCQNEEKCSKAHTMALNQWGLHELYRKLQNDPDRDAKVLEAMRKNLDHTRRDIFMMLGSFRGIMWNFGLMDTYSPPIEAQTKLNMEI